jgi:hypothetical protein
VNISVMPARLLIVPVTSASAFEVFGWSFGLNMKVEGNLLIRTEARQFVAEEKVYLRNGRPADRSLNLTANVCVWV